ncbi:MAG TPA: VOC family protein [Bryobacteraceae bacterium]|nr:VOC family protein [Bryobacteraceae bacterium]
MITRRQILGLLAGSGAARGLRGAELSFALDHFKLRVANLDKSVAFYYSLFGGPLSEVQGGSFPSPPDLKAIFFKIGSGKTYLILSPPDPKVPVGLEHVAIDAAAMAIVKEHGLPLAFPDQSYVRDPDGNLLELVGTGYWNQPERVGRSPQLPQELSSRTPVFEPLEIQRVILRVSDLDRAAGFYRLFASEIGGSVARGLRNFDLQGTTLELVTAPSPGLFGFTVSVRKFEEARVRRALKALSIAFLPSSRGTLAFYDPDGTLVGVDSTRPPAPVERPGRID